MNDHSSEPAGFSFWLTVILAIAGFLLFGVLLYVMYLPERSTATTPIFSAEELAEIEKLPPAERDARRAELRWQHRTPTPEDRKAKLVELHEKEAAALSGYSIDQQTGAVRLPIDRAMELTLQEVQQARGRESR